MNPFEIEFFDRQDLIESIGKSRALVYSPSEEIRDIFSGSYPRESLSQAVYEQFLLPCAQDVLENERNDPKTALLVYPKPKIVLSDFESRTLENMEDAVKLFKTAKNYGIRKLEKENERNPALCYAFGGIIGLGVATGLIVSSISSNAELSFAIPVGLLAIPEGLGIGHVLRSWGVRDSEELSILRQMSVEGQEIYDQLITQ